MFHFQGIESRFLNLESTPCPVLQRVTRPALTCTLGPAHKRRPRWASSPLSGPSQQHADVVLRVWIQVPQLICDHVDSVHLWPRRLAGAVLNLLPDNGAISQDRVGVELDDQVSGAGTQQLWRCDGGWGNCEKKWKAGFFFIFFFFFSFPSQTQLNWSKHLLAGPWRCRTV